MRSTTRSFLSALERSCPFSEEPLQMLRPLHWDLFEELVRNLGIKPSKASD